MLVWYLQLEMHIIILVYSSTAAAQDGLHTSTSTQSLQWLSRQRPPHFLSQIQSRCLAHSRLTNNTNCMSTYPEYPWITIRHYITTKLWRMGRWDLLRDKPMRTSKAHCRSWTRRSRLGCHWDWRERLVESPPGFRFDLAFLCVPCWYCECNRNMDRIARISTVQRSKRCCLFLWEVPWLLVMFAALRIGIFRYFTDDTSWQAARLRAGQDRPTDCFCNMQVYPYPELCYGL